MNWYAAPGIKKIITPQIMTPSMQICTAKHIIQVVSKFYGLDPDQLSKKDRRLQIIKCKYLCIYLIIQRVRGLSLIMIGELFGGVDHTTVIHAREKVSGQLSSKFENDFKTDYKTLIQII